MTALKQSFKRFLLHVDAAYLQYRLLIYRAGYPVRQPDDEYTIKTVNAVEQMCDRHPSKHRRR